MSPTAKICAAADQQNSCFDIRVTDIENMEVMRNLHTHVTAAGFVWLSASCESPDTCVATIGCVQGSVLMSRDLPLIKGAIESAGVSLAT